MIEHGIETGSVVTPLSTEAQCIRPLRHWGAQRYVCHVALGSLKCNVYLRHEDSGLPYSISVSPLETKRSKY